MVSGNHMQPESTTRRVILNLLAGGLAGLAAAIPMGLLMMGLNRYLPGRDRPALPPKQITARLARKVKAQKVVPPGQSWGLSTWLAHLGYGAATASAYEMLTRPIPLPNFLRGMLFAMGIWAGSYLGWIPAMSILPPATQQSKRRNLIMIASHLLWGSLIGLTTGPIKEKAEETL